MAVVKTAFDDESAPTERDGLPAHLPPGATIDRYVIDALLGTGGFGAVYRAHHVVLGTSVALKVLHADRSVSKEIVERLFREARAAASIGGPHVARVSDCGVTADGRAFLAMELLDGVVLEELLLEGPLPFERAMSVILQVLDGLAVVHAAGIVHRDLKPANIFLARDPDSGGDFVKLLDFGISKVTMGEVGTPLSTLTRTGVVMGTPAYMAPEQYRGAREVDLRADLYATGVASYRVLAGTTPHEAKTLEELVARVFTEKPRSLSALAPGLPLRISQVIERSLAVDPDGRWQSAAEMAYALRAALADLPSLGAIQVTQARPRVEVPVVSTVRPVHRAQLPETTPSLQAPASASDHGAPNTPLVTASPTHPSVAPPRPPPNPSPRLWLWASAVLLGALCVALLTWGGLKWGTRRLREEGAAEQAASIASPTAPAPATASAQLAPLPSRAPFDPDQKVEPPHPKPPEHPTEPRAEAPATEAPARRPLVPEPRRHDEPVAATPLVNRPTTSGSGRLNFFPPRMLGTAHPSTIDPLFLRGRARAEVCVAGAGRGEVDVQLFLQAQGEITIASASPFNQGDESIAVCIAEALKAAIPPGWRAEESTTGIARIRVTY